MSSNRLMYDTCEYKTRLSTNADTLEYLLDPVRYENCNKCRVELGVVGGTAIAVAVYRSGADSVLALLQL